MPARFVFGHLGNGKGAGFIERDAAIPREVCQKYFVYDCRGKETRVSYEPASEDLYMLVFTTNLPEGSSAEKREQIFVDGYGFTREEITEIMERPGELLKFPYYVSPDDYKNGRTTTLSEKAGAMDKKQMPAAQKAAYFHSVLNNFEGMMENQLLHIIEPFKEEKWQKTLISALKIFPPEIRREITFCVNPYSVTEAKDYEWNFVSSEVYDKFDSSGFAGGKLMDRIIVSDQGVEGVTMTKEKKEVLKSYESNKKEILEEIRAADGDRERFRALLTEIREPEEIVDEKPKKDRKKNREKKGIKNWAVFIAEMLLVVASGMWLVLQFHVYWNPTSQYFTIRVDNNVVVFLAQFVFAFLTAAVVNNIKKRMRGE